MHVARQVALLALAFLACPLGADATLSVIVQVASAPSTAAQARPGPVARFRFDGNVESATGTRAGEAGATGASFVDGLAGQAVSLSPDRASTFLTLPLASLGSGSDFSIRFWVRSDAGSDRRFVVLSQKKFADNSLASQKKPRLGLLHVGGRLGMDCGRGFTPHHV